MNFSNAICKICIHSFETNYSRSQGVVKSTGKSSILKPVAQLTGGAGVRTAKRGKLNVKPGSR